MKRGCCSWVAMNGGKFSWLAQASAVTATAFTGLEYANHTHNRNTENALVTRDRLLIVDLTNLVLLEKNCPGEADGIFHDCYNDYSELRLMKSPDRSDMIPWEMTFSTYFPNNASIPEMSRPFAPHLVAVKDAFINSWGFIFDSKSYYLHGGCVDKSYYTPNFEYYMPDKDVVEFSGPIISLIHPYPGLYFHEFVEIFAALYMSMPLIKLMPNITILVSKRFQAKTIAPLVSLITENITNLNFVAYRDRMKNKYKAFHDTLYFAPYIVTPISLWCQYMSRTTTLRLREIYSQLPYWGKPGNGIVIIDRINMRPRRFLAQGKTIFEFMNSTYGHSHSVRMFYGNETLEETVILFRGCRVLIAAHGGGQSNMLFMPSGGSVIEVRSTSWQVTCFVDLANCINVKHFTYLDVYGRQKFELNVNMELFIPWASNIVNDALNINNTLPNIKYIR